MYYVEIESSLKCEIFVYMQSVLPKDPNSENITLLQKGMTQVIKLHPMHMTTYHHTTSSH